MILDQKTDIRFILIWYRIILFSEESFSVLYIVEVLIWLGMSQMSDVLFTY